MIGHLELVKDDRGHPPHGLGSYTPTRLETEGGENSRFYVLPVSFSKGPDLFALSPDEGTALRQFADDTRALEGVREYHYAPVLRAEPH